MVRLSRLNGSRFVVNVDLVTYLEATPDTAVTLTNGDKFLVRETVDEIIAMAVEYRRRIFQGPIVIPQEP
jgi:flagellar protein FlbD